MGVEKNTRLEKKKIRPSDGPAQCRIGGTWRPSQINPNPPQRASECLLACLLRQPSHMSSNRGSEDSSNQERRSKMDSSESDDRRGDTFFLTPPSLSLSVSSHDEPPATESVQS